MKTKSIIGGRVSVTVKGSKDDYCIEGYLVDYVMVNDMNCLVIRNGKDFVIPSGSVLFIQILELNDVELIEDECKEVV